VSQARADGEVRRGGRALRYEVTGAPHGTPVFLLHGTPGSRLGPKPRTSVLYRLGVRLITYDRPGYGGSDRDEKRSVADAATDVDAIATHLGIDRFAVVGRSGGGPHALACAALLGARVTCVAVLVSLAPAGVQEIDWFGGMTAANVREYKIADEDEAKLIESLRLQADRARRDPWSMVDVLRAQMTDPDLQVVHDLSIRKLLAQTYAEALRPGPYGWIDDVLAYRRDWGFAIESITQPALLWHGDQDNFSPPSHTTWLAGRIPQAELQLQTDTAHFGAVEILPAVLAWTAARRPELVAARTGIEPG
jgi:pimeloyl-ACP methyl ester carboxylesterase